MEDVVDLSIEPVTPALGAVVEGVDLRLPLAASTIQILRDELFNRGVIFFRNQDLTRDQMSACAGAFGRPYRDDGYAFFPDRDITRDQARAFVQRSHTPSPGLANQPDPVIDFASDGTEQATYDRRYATAGSKKVTDEWHADTTAITDPPIATMLRAVRIPPVGGDTLWASMYAAYDALSEPLRDMLDGLTAVHSLTSVLERSGQKQFYFGSDVVAVHPVVRAHPETGRKALYVNQTWTTRIVELEPVESSHILAMLFEHVKSPDFNMRWRWAPNDIAVWDNRVVLHYAVADYDTERAMQRIVIASERDR